MSSELEKVYLAIDLGAGSGRVLAGEICGGRIELHEVSRFENNPVQLSSGWHWAIEALFEEILVGLKLAGEKYGNRIVSIGVDSWGVDYGLFDGDGRLLGLPYQYRDARTDGMMEKVFSKVPKKEIYESTGIQFMYFNTIFQLAAEREKGGPQLEAAEHLLFIPQIIGYWLTGQMKQERSMASTSQLYDPKRQDWDYGLIERLGIPEKLFKSLAEPGDFLGNLKESVQQVTGLGAVKVISVAGHDTANAVAGIPIEGECPAFLSSGTWSLMGLELEGPVINEQSYAGAFTNEVGVNRTVRFLKNLCGLWLIQESRRHWLDAGLEIDYSMLASLAAEAAPFQAFIDPDAPIFAKPGDMPETIKQYCLQSGQAVPGNENAIIRCIYESLALRYAQVWEQLKAYSAEPLSALHIVGGGCQDALLNQMTANAIGAPVLAGPVEATGYGNIMTQAISDGLLPDLKEARRMLMGSVTLERFEPLEQEVWDLQKQRFAKLTDRK